MEGFYDSLWVGQGVLALWRRGGWWRLGAGLAFLLGGLLFRGLWLAPLGVVLAGVLPGGWRYAALVYGGVLLARNMLLEVVNG